MDRSRPTVTATEVTGQHTQRKAPRPESAQTRPVQTDSMSAWGYFGCILLMHLPILGIITAIVWACGGCQKHCKRSLARAMLLFWVICAIVALIAVSVLYATLDELLVSFGIDGISGLFDLLLQFT